MCQYVKIAYFTHGSKNILVCAYPCLFISVCTNIRILRACTYIQKLLCVAYHCVAQYILQLRILSICIDLWEPLLVYGNNNNKNIKLKNG